VMRIQKEEELEIVDQSFDSECSITLGVRKTKVDKILKRLMRIQDIYTLLDS